MQILIAGFLLSLSLCLDLGVVNVATIKTGVERGFLPSLFLGLGAGIGDIIYSYISTLGISIILNNHIFRWFLWVFGTIILLYMCFNMIKESIKPKELSEFTKNDNLTSNASCKDFLYGIGLSLFSPSSILWFATIGGSVIASTNTKGTYSVLLFIAGFFIASEVWSTFVAFLASRGSKYMNAKVMRGFSILSSMLFLYFAIKIFISGYQNLIK